LQNKHRHCREQTENHEPPEPVAINPDRLAKNLLPRSAANDQVGGLGGRLVVGKNFRHFAGGNPTIAAHGPNFVLGNQPPFFAPFAKIILIDGSVFLPFHPHHPLFRHGGSLIAFRANRYLALILTFSQREKELPLPKGEGWGEGHIAAMKNDEDARRFATFRT
jgi:hypothetical protein